MKLPTIDDIDIKDKKVLVRADLDAKVDDKRIDVAINTLQKIIEKEPQKIFILGSRGRPKEGENDTELSLSNLIDKFNVALSQDVALSDDWEWRDNFVVLFENIRFKNEEYDNSSEIASKFLDFADVYINESFAMSHRENMSLNALPKLFKDNGKPIAFGPRFIEEVEQLSKLNEADSPYIVLLSGVKEDKLEYLEKFYEIADKVLIGGRLPEYLGEDYSHPKAIVGNLIQDKEDITLHTVEKFEEVVKSAKTILISGPLGKFEEEGHRQGTKRVLEAISENADALKIAGGGNTEQAISLFKLEDKFDWISIGGGAMLDFVVNGSLPAIEVVALSL